MDLVERYLHDLMARGMSERTIQAYSWALKKVFLPWLKAHRLEPLSPMNGVDAQRFRSEVMDTKAPATANLILSVVRGFYDFLLEFGLVTHNPFASKRLRVKQGQGLPRFLKDWELARVFEWLSRNAPPHILLAFKLMLHAGLRHSEVSSLTPESIVTKEVEGKEVVLLSIRGKGDKERLAPVLDVSTAKELLKYVKTKPGRLFPSPATLRWWAARVAKETGIDFSTHRLRHTFGTRTLAEGAPLDVLQDFMGHASITTTRRYAQTLAKARLEAIAKLVR